MTIQEVKETIEKWIRSCERAEQVDLLAEVVAEFIVNRFEKEESPLLITIVRDDLLQQMAEQKVIIKRKYFQTLNKPS